MVASGPFEKWGIDAMGKLPRTSDDKIYILVAIDYMTKWKEAQAISKFNEHIVISKFVYTDICVGFGDPRKIIAYHGPHFCDGLLTSMCEEFKIKRTCKRLSKR